MLLASLDDYYLEEEGDNEMGGRFRLVMTGGGFRGKIR